MKYIILYLILLVTPQAHAWVVKADFESGNVGDKAQGDDAFTGAFSNTLYSKEHVLSGKQAAIVSIKKGSTGFGEFGGTFRFPSVKVGEEIWFRTATYFPSDFEFDEGGGLGKGMRLHTTKAGDNSNGGYIDVYFKSGRQTISNEASLNDFIANNPDWQKKGSPISKGKWVYFEQYVKVAAKPNAGIYRVWQDGVLIHEDTKTYTVKDSTSVIDFAYYLSYWNAGSPKDNSLWIDDVVITNQRPESVDSAGNRFLGVEVGNISITAAPKPPLLSAN